MTQQRIGSLLFPDDIEISLDERVRKTVRPLSEKLISAPFLQALSNQVESDLRKSE